MPLRRCLLFLFISILCLPATAGAAAYTYDYNASCDKAYQQFLSLHLKEGHKYISNELSTNPTNLMATYLADYEDCILLLLNSDPAVYEEKAGNLDKRLTALDAGTHSSPWYRLCKAGIYLHWAIISVRFGEQYRAALHFRHSFALLRENQQLYPAFEYNDVFAGLEEAVVGSLPGSYKWVASVFGLKGSIKKGTGRLASFVSTHHQGQPLYNEAVLYHLYTRFYLLSEQHEVWNFLTSSQFPIHNNLLHAFVRTNIALDYRRAGDALETLQAATTDPAYASYPIFSYQTGCALLTRLDTAAVGYFQQYLATNKSGLYIKDTWQKMAMAWYAAGNTSRANACLAQAASQGTTKIDADKQANRFAQAGKWPPMALLQARLLIEGGYYDRALALLQHIDEALLKDPVTAAEYHFRLGRIYEELAAAGRGREYFQQAFAQYRAAMAAGKDRHEQFAARAALHTGKLYEQLNMKTEATAQYQQCLDMPSHDFQNSIDQQAKAGINRMEGR